MRDFLRDRYPRELEKKGDRWELSPEQALGVCDHFFSSNEADPASLYRTFMTLLDELQVRLLGRGVELRDRLDAQGIVWWLVKSPPPDSAA